MRELTGYEDRHGRPILEGDIVRSHAGEINVVAQISEGWYPWCFFKERELASIEVIGSLYTSAGRALLAASDGTSNVPVAFDCDVPWTEDLDCVE